MIKQGRGSGEGALAFYSDCALTGGNFPQEWRGKVVVPSVSLFDRGFLKTLVEFLAIRKQFVIVHC